MFQFDQFYLSYDDVLLLSVVDFHPLGVLLTHMDESWKMFQFDLEYNIVIRKEREAQQQQQQFHHNTKPNANV
jgi:hypothetical protein